MTVGLVLTVVALAIAVRRLWWLKRLAFSGQPAPERVTAVREHPGRDVRTQTAEVLGQRKLLKWTVPGVAHFLTFWGFTILLLTIIESYGALFNRTFSLPWIGHWAFVGFNTERIEEALELNPDTISTACPYCLVMLGDAIAAKKSTGEAKDTLEVVDVAQLLARSVRATAPVAVDGDSGTDGRRGAADEERRL